MDQRRRYGTVNTRFEWTQRHVIVLVLALVTVLFSCNSNAARSPSPDLPIHSSMEEIENGSEVDDALYWGLPDRSIPMGKVFQYHLSSSEDAAENTGYSYEMTEEDERSLPSWLHWNKEKHYIEGLPTADQKGQLVGIHVTRQGAKPDGSTTSSKESFFLKVVDTKEQSDNAYQYTKPSHDDDESIHCRTGSAVTTATVILDVTTVDLLGRERVDMFRSLSSYLHLPISVLSLKPAGDTPDTPLWHEDALVAGPGDTPLPIHLPGTLVQWIVGCGSVLDPHMSILEQLEGAAGNGSLGRAVGRGIVGWYITNDSGAKQTKRKRQAFLHANPTPTPVPSMGHPSLHPSATRVVHETYHYGGSEFRPEKLPSSMWLRPQLEIFIKTKPVSGRPPRPSYSFDFGPTSVTSTIQPTRPVDSGFITTWPGQYPPGVVYPSTEYSGKPTSGYSTYVEPSMEYGHSSSVTPTASLPDWSRYPGGRESTPGWITKYPYTEKPEWKEDGSSTLPYPDSTSVKPDWTSGYPHTDGPGIESWPGWLSSQWSGEHPPTDHPESTYTFPSPSDLDNFPSTTVKGWDTSDRVSENWPSIYPSTSKPFEQPSSTQVPHVTTSIHPTSVAASSPPSTTVTPKQKYTKKPAGSEKNDNYPRLVNPLPKISAEVGKLLWFKIPRNTFYDEEDGFTDNLRLLKLMNEDRTTVRPVSWIKLNETSQTLYGLALRDHRGTHRFIVAAVDADRQITESPLEVRVREADNVERMSHEFSVTLDVSYRKFYHDVELRLAVLNKIAQAFGDKDSSKITVTRISEGSVVIHWTNNSLPLEPCPAKAIVALNQHLLLPDGSLNQTFVQAMRPYRVLDASGAPHGSCAVEFTTSPPEEVVTMITPGPDEPARKEVQTSSFLLYLVIAIIIFLILLLILVIVCVVCYKKHRNRREKDNEEKLDGAHKGVPVIFADELDESGIGNGVDEATPVSTLKSVKSVKDTDTVESVPPPEYTRSKPTSASSTLRSDWKAPLLSEHEDNGSDDNTLEKKAIDKDSKKVKDVSQYNAKAVR